ncbi:MAG: SDR family oxidoreductase [Armatimonadetes bacterium]|nr:SDR family oxidoreductase [Armatimonadota bacterium]
MTQKIALVTGSVRGIGKVIAERLEAKGWTVVRHAQTATELEGLAGVAGDLAEASVPEAIITEVIEKYGRLDALVNNAALTTRSNLETTDVALFDRLMAVNLRAPLLLIQAALPHFRAQGGGKVVNIGSSNAYCGERNLLAYSMTKAGLMVLTRNLGDAHGAEGVRVNQLNLGWTISDSEYALKISEGLPPDWPERLPKSVAPSGGLQTPEDVAAMVSWLLSDDAPRVNGQVWDFEQYPLIGRNPPKDVAT